HSAFRQMPAEVHEILRRGDDEVPVRQRGTQTRAPRGTELGRRERPHLRRSRVAPAAEEVRLELARDRQVVAAGLERIGCLYPSSHTLVGSQFRSSTQKLQPCTREEWNSGHFCTSTGTAATSFISWAFACFQ